MKMKALLVLLCRRLFDRRTQSRLLPGFFFSSFTGCNIAVEPDFVLILVRIILLIDIDTGDDGT